MRSILGLVKFRIYIFYFGNIDVVNIYPAVIICVKGVCNGVMTGIKIKGYTLLKPSAP